MNPYPMKIRIKHNQETKSSEKPGESKQVNKSDEIGFKQVQKRKEIPNQSESNHIQQVNQNQSISSAKIKSQRKITSKFSIQAHQNYV